MPDEFLTVAEVAELLKLNPQTIRNWVDRGELQAVRVGSRRVRVRKSDLDLFLAAGATSMPENGDDSGQRHATRPDDLVLQILGYEVALHSQFVLLGSEQLDEALRLVPQTGPTREQWETDPTVKPAYYLPRIWFAAQNLLVHAANLSKFLWGTKGATGKVERAELRARLNVSEGSCLKSRLVRNHFEHYDERIMTWQREGHPIFASRNLGAVGPGEPSESERFAHLDPDTRIVTFLGERISLPDIVAKAGQLYDAAIAATYGGS